MYKTKTIGKGEYWQQEVCADCGGEVELIMCDDCEDGFSHHDCGEDCCCCLNPENNVRCDTCGGDGGWYVCLSKCHENKNEVTSAIPPNTKVSGILAPIL